jgi:hypothetical protein
MFRSYAATVAHYRALQSGAHRITEDAFEGSGLLPAPLTLRFYDARAEDAWRATWRLYRHPAGGGGWPWPLIMQTRWRRPSAFRLAIWSGPTLCRLAIGHPSKRTSGGQRSFVSLEMMEGAPFVHPLRGSVARVTALFAETYCTLLGGSRVRLIAPAPGLLGWYMLLGFRPVYRNTRPIHSEREVQDGKAEHA